MASPAQTRANQANAQKSTGAKTAAGKQASSQNRHIHGLCHHNERFYFLADEDPEKFRALSARLEEEHQPQTETERILVRRMADHEWLRTRALRLQHTCIFTDEHVIATSQFGLYMRYQTSHERAFYKALTELQKLRAERRKEQIGFEAQKRQAAADTRAAEAQNLKKQEFELKKAALEFKKQRTPPVTSQKTPPTTPETSPGGSEMAA